MSRVAVSALLVLAAGCSNPTTSGNDMASSDMAEGLDLTQSAKPDMALIHAGTRVDTGKDDQLIGVTTDDHAVFFNASSDLFAVSLGGGNAQMVAAAADIGGIQGKVVFAWSNLDMNTYTGDLTAWTAAGGSKPVATNVSAVVSAASDDGTSIFYALATAGDGTVGDLYISKPDGSAAKKLFTDTILLGDNSLSPIAEFAGGKFIVAHAEIPPMNDGGVPDGGMASPTGLSVDAIDPSSGAVTHLALDASHFFSADKAGTKVLVADKAGAAQLVPIGGGQGSAVDTNVAIGRLSPDGTRAVYRTNDSKLKSSPVPAAMPVELVGTGVTEILDYSPDFKFALYDTNPDNNTGLSDIYLANTTTAGAPAKLADMNAAVYGSGFTTDASRSLIFAEVNADYVGKLVANPVAGGMPQTFATSAWYVWATKGAQVAFNDHYNGKAGNLNGRGDLYVSDLAKTDAPTLIAQAAEVDFFLSTQKNKIVYSYNAAGGAEGLYVADVP